MIEAMTVRVVESFELLNRYGFWPWLSDKLRPLDNY